MLYLILREAYKMQTIESTCRGVPCRIFFCFVDRASLYNLVNRTNLVHNFSYYIYSFSLHVSGNYVPIIRRKHCTYATPGYVVSNLWESIIMLLTLIILKT